MTATPRPDQIYRHFKGNLYRIITLAIHSETGETMVVYQALYGDYTVYVRELSMFMSKVDRKKYPDAEQEERFMLLPQIIGQSAGAPAPQSVQPQSTAASAPQPVQPQSAGASAPQPVQPQSAAASAPQSIDAADEQPTLDPQLMQFLDADTYAEKLNLLVALHAKITDAMINTMAVSLDIEINDGDPEERYEALKTCLLTLEKYECNRLR